MARKIPSIVLVYNNLTDTYVVDSICDSIMHKPGEGMKEREVHALCQSVHWKVRIIRK
jgi:hypothetical protein